MKFTLLFIVLGFTIWVRAQAPAIQWQRSFGGGNDDYLQATRQTSDSGYISVGWTKSNNGDVSGNHGNQVGGYGYEEYWIVKTSPAGILQWKKILGGLGDDRGHDIRQTTDGGYIVAGETSSNNDGDVTGNHTSTNNNPTSDCWIVKLDPLGNIMWEKSYGGSGNDIAYCIRQTTDGGYIFAGSSTVNDGDVTSNTGWQDFWIVKIDTAGVIQWQRSMGTAYTDYVTSIEQTNDGGFVFTGPSALNLDYRFSVLKLDANGNVVWGGSFGGSGDDLPNALVQTPDGGYLVAGWTGSSDGDVTFNHGTWDYWVIKLDSIGVMKWQKTYGSSTFDLASALCLTPDGGFAVAGYTQGNDQDVLFNHSTSQDYWIIKCDTSGTIQWQSSLGGTGLDIAASIQPTMDGGFIVGGYSASSDGDVTLNQGMKDFWLVKLENPGAVKETPGKNTFSVYPVPCTDELHIRPTDPSSKEHYILFDATGHIVLEGNLNGSLTTVHLSNISPGFYLLRLLYPEPYSVKVVKE